MRTWNQSTKNSTSPNGWSIPIQIEMTDRAARKIRLTDEVIGAEVQTESESSGDIPIRRIWAHWWEPILESIIWEASTKTCIISLIKHPDLTLACWIVIAKADVEVRSRLSTPSLRKWTMNDDEGSRGVHFHGEGYLSSRCVYLGAAHGEGTTRHTIVFSALWAGEPTWTKSMELDSHKLLI